MTNTIFCVFIIDGKEMDLGVERIFPFVIGQTVTFQDPQVKGVYKVTDVNDVYCDDDHSYVHNNFEHADNLTVVTLVTKETSTSF